MHFAPAPGVPGVPDARAPAEAVRGGRSKAAADTGPLVRAVAPGRGRQRHPHAGAGAGSGAGGRAGGDPRAARRSARRTGLSALFARRAPAEVARRAGRSGIRRSARRTRGGAGAPRAERDAAPAGAAAARAPARRDLAAAGVDRDVPAARIPAHRVPRGRTSSGRCSGSHRPTRSNCPPATNRWCSSPRRRRRTRSIVCCEPAIGGLGTLAGVRVLATWNRRAHRAAGAGDRIQHAAGRVGQLRADDAACGRRRLPRRAWNGRPRARERLRGGLRTGGRRHERERRARRLGRRRRTDPAQARASRVRSAWPCSARSGNRDSRPRPQRSPRGTRPMTRPTAPRSSWRRWSREPAVELRGWDSNPQPNG